MGVVYAAHDTGELDRDVAIKVLPAAFSSNAEWLRRFELEARSASTLKHANILTVYDFGRHEGSPYVVSELLEGRTLRARFAGDPLSQRKVIDYATQIALGLAAAHARGIVHRDLKPENIFITNEGQVKILDFGLAKLVEPINKNESQTEVPTRIDNTIPGAVVGTLGYMSPEQVDSQPVDYRSDIFTFGIVLYEMLAWQRAFPQRGTLRETLHAIVKEDPPALAKVNPQVSPALEKLVERCLEKEPQNRFQSTGDLAFALEALPGASATSHSVPSAMTSGPTVAQSAATIGAVPTKARARRSLLPFLAGAVALALASSLIAFFIGRRAGASPPALYRQLTFRRGTIWNARFAPDGRTILYSAAWSGNPMDIFSVRTESADSRSLGMPGADVLAVSSSGEVAVLLNRRYLGWFISRGTLARTSLVGGAPRELLEDVQEADWSPDGTKLAVVRWVEGKNRLEYPIGRVLYETSGYLSHPRISPQGDTVAFLNHQVVYDNRGTVELISAGGEKRTLSEELSSVEGLAWLPGGDEVWFTASKVGEPLALYAVTPKGASRLVTRVPVALMLHDISRDGRILLTRYDQPTDIFGLMPGETKERDLAWLDMGEVRDLSADGKTFLVEYQGEGSGINYTVYLARTDGSPAVRLGEGGARSLSPDGKWVLSILSTPPQVVLLPTGAGEPVRLERHGIEQYSFRASWLPDGKRIIFLAREPGHNWRFYIQDIEGGAPPRAVSPEGVTGPGYELLVSPDGKSFIGANAQGTRSLYSLAGAEPSPIMGLPPSDSVIGWNTDGRSVYVSQTQEMPLKGYRLNLSNGRKELLKEVMPADTAGIFWPNSIFITPDGRGYVYKLQRILSDLYLVEGLQ